MIVDGESQLLSADEREGLIAQGDLVIQESAGGPPPVTGNGHGPAVGNNGNGTNGNGASTNGKSGTGGARLQKLVELHELKDGEQLFRQLADFSLSIDDYFLTQEESVSGEKLMTRYALISDDKVISVAGVGRLLDEVLALGKHGMEVKRFKGLGEMNAEELWETTLDRSKRTLLRVTLEEAGEAERLFTVLMGEDVERRRQFIEDHALEVKNLDV